MEYDFNKSDFLDSMEAYGTAAAAAVGVDDDEYNTQYRKTLDTFIKGYYFYLLDVYKLPISVLKGVESETLSDRKEKVGYCFDFALEDLADNNSSGLTRAIKNYSPDKANSDPYPFFRYLMSYYVLPGQTYAKSRKINDRRGGIVAFRDKQDRRLLQKLLDYWESRTQVRKIPDALSLKNKEEMSKDLGIDMDTLNKILRENADTFFPDSIYGSSPDGESDDSASDYLLNDPALQVELEAFTRSEDLFEKCLKKMNQVYDESFQELHRRVFPPCLTSDYIKMLLQDVMRYTTAQTYGDVISQFWDDIPLEDRKERYANGNYRCISRPVFNWFERNRKIVQRSLIANKLNLTESRASKCYNQAMEVVRKSLSISEYRDD